MANTTEKQIERERRIFDEYPIPKALAVMILPTIMSQVIHVLYNMADTWFVGLTNDANAVAAISVCFPIYNLLTCISNLFGIGGAGVIARQLGTGRRGDVKKTFSLCCWLAAAMAIVYAALLAVIGRPLLMLVGAESGDIDYALQYSLITIIIGGLPAVLAATVSHLIRAVGDSGKAGAGLTLGAVLNIVLDPIFMFVLLPRGNELVGAAVATAVSNLASLVYFAVYLIRRRDSEFYSLSPRHMAGSGAIAADVVKSGIPSSLMYALTCISGTVTNALVKTVGSTAAVAGLGVVRKIDSLAFSVNQGITQGMLPLVAYSYAAGRYDRMKRSIAISAAASVIISLICTAFSEFMPEALIRLFIQDAETVFYGARFLKILCLSIPIYCVTYIVIAVFQATGHLVQPFILSLRRGVLDTAVFFLIRAVWGAEYILWGSPAIETAAMITAVIMFAFLMKKLQENRNV